MTQSSNPFEAPNTPVGSDRPLPMGGGEFAPCPSCGSNSATKVGYTWWGGFVGPRLLNHVKCSSCSKTFNGKTGKSNDQAIAIYLGAGVVLGIVVFVIASMS